MTNVLSFLFENRIIALLALKTQTNIFKILKKMRLLTAMLLLASVFIGFNACSDDDDKDKEENYIIGMWDVMEKGSIGEVIEYKSNGTFEYYYTEEHKDENETGKYKIESGKLYQMWDEDDVPSWSVYKIHELNSTSLVIEEYEEGDKLSGYIESFQKKK